MAPGAGVNQGEAWHPLCGLRLEKPGEPNRGLVCVWGAVSSGKSKVRLEEGCVQSPSRTCQVSVCPAQSTRSPCVTSFVCLFGFLVESSPLTKLFCQDKSKASERFCGGWQ